MASRKTRHQTLLAEIMDVIQHIAYKKCLCNLNDEDVISIEEFDNSELASRYWLDTKHCIAGRKQNKINIQNLYEIFGSYTGHTSDEVRKMVIKEVNDNMKWYRSRANVPLSMKFVTIEKWLEAQKRRTVPGDEITVYVLSVIFRRHTIIFTKTKPWCTVEVDCNDTAMDIINKCETTLLYLGPQLFGVLRPHPFTIWPPRVCDLRVVQGLRSVDREDGQLLIEKPLDLSKTSTIELVCDKIKIPLVNDEILIRHNELKSKASERPPPPVVELSDDEPDRENSPLVGSFGLMAGYKEFVERDLDQNNNLNDVDNIGVVEGRLPEVTPANEGSLTPTNIVLSTAQIQLPDATNAPSSITPKQLPDATAETEITYTVLIPDVTGQVEPMNNSQLPDETGGTMVHDSIVNTSPVTIGHLGVRDQLIGGHEQGPSEQQDSDSDNESISLLTGERVIIQDTCFSPSRSIRDKDDWNLSLDLDNNSDDTIDPLFRYYEAPTKNGDDLLYLHYEDIVNRKCIVKMKKLSIDEIGDQSIVNNTADTDSNPEVTGSNINCNNDPKSEEHQTEQAGHRIDDTGCITPPQPQQNDNQTNNPSNQKQHVVAESDVDSDHENMGITYNTDSDLDISTQKSGYSLRQRPSPSSLQSRLNHRPARENTLKDYRNMDDEPETPDITPTKKPSNRPDATPSQTGMNAQKQIIKHHERNGKPTPGPRPVPKRFMTKNPSLTPQKAAKPTRSKLVPDATSVEQPLPDATSHDEDSYQSDDTVLYDADTDNEDSDGITASPKTTGTSCSKPVHKPRKKHKTSPPKGTWLVKTHGRPKRLRKVKHVCAVPQCHVTKKSYAALNAHYKDNHPKLICVNCNKIFAIPASLRKHSYTHKATDWTCRRCGKSYPFQSQLQAHKLSHGRHPENKCIYPGCHKIYTYIWDLTKHAKTHNAKRIKCPKKNCDYTAIDKRNLKQHNRIHTKDKPYNCLKCGEAFRFTMQRKRHYVRNTCRAPSLSPSPSY